MKLVIAIGVGLVCVGIGIVHWQLAQLRPAWPGAVVPLLWVGTAGALVATGGVESLVDVAGLVLVTVVLARIWHDGRRRRAERARPTAVEV